MGLKSGAKTFKEVFSAWSEDYASNWAAAVGYYAIFSLAPLLLIAIAIAGLVFGERASQGMIVGQIEGVVGPTAAQGIESLLASVARPGAGVAATVIGLLLLLWTASVLFGCIRNALNFMWGFKPSGGNAAVSFIRQRLVMFGLVAGTGVILLLSVFSSILLSAFGRKVGEILSMPPIVLSVLQFAVFLALIAALFAMIFRFLPDGRAPWRDIFAGALVAALLFGVGKAVLGIYFAKSNPASGFGAAGSLIIVLLWIYYSAQIFFLGAEYVKISAKRKGRWVKAE